jgi:hypothetical protein
MDLQAAQSMKEKRGIVSRLTVTFCLILTAGLLISSLVAPSRAQTSQSRSPAPLLIQL